MSDNVSVIIRCKNEEQWIGHSIQSVLDFIDNPEIIIADNDSTDDSMDIVRGFESWHNIKRIKIKDYSPGKAINKCVEISSMEYMLIFSAHCCFINVDFNEVKNYIDEGYAAVFGKQIPIYRGRRISERNIWSHFIEQNSINMWSNLENRYFLHNALCFYKKDILKKFPFDEKLYGKEDRYWAAKIRENDFNFLYTPKIRCNHHWTASGATWKGIG